LRGWRWPTPAFRRSRPISRQVGTPYKGLAAYLGLSCYTMKPCVASSNPRSSLPLKPLSRIRLASRLSSDYRQRGSRTMECRIEQVPITQMVTRIFGDEGAGFEPSRHKQNPRRQSIATFCRHALRRGVGTVTVCRSGPLDSFVKPPYALVGEGIRKSQVLASCDHQTAASGRAATSLTY
jgi:hypothetical protein